jgi:hypothetical protein
MLYFSWTAWTEIVGKVALFETGPEGPELED